MTPFSFARLHRSTSYWTVLFALLFANGMSWFTRSPTDAAAGFPFPFWIDDGAGGGLLVTGLLLDIVLAWTLAVIAAWVSLLFRRR